MPRAAWLAVGAVAAALAAAAEAGIRAGGDAAIAGAGARDVAAALPAVALALAAAGLAISRSSGRWAALCAGALLVALRLAIGSMQPAAPQTSPPGSLRDAVAEVVSISAPSGGAQRAVVAVAPGDRLPSVRLYARLPRYPEVVPGDRVTVSGTVRPPPDGPGFGDYLRRAGIAGTVTARTLDRAPAPGGPAAWLEGRRRDAGEILASVLPAPQAGLAAGILVGLRDQVDRDVAAAFTAAGLTHIVAISGWNIAVVSGVLSTLLRRIARRRRSVATLAVIAAYTLAAGAGASVVRAAAMAGAVLGARELGRPGTAASALGLAVVAMLAVDPAVVGDAGFQLSVAATAGLLAWGTPLTGWFHERVSGDGARFAAPGWLIDSLAVSLAAQAATLPLVLLDFGRISLVAPAANLVAAPLVVPVMAASAAALAAGWIGSLVSVVPGATGPGLAAAPGAPSVLAPVTGLLGTATGWAIAAVGTAGGLVIGALVAVARLAAAVPGASITLGPPAQQILAGLTVLAVGAVALPGGRQRLCPIAAAFHRHERGPREPGRGHRAPREPATAGCGHVIRERARPAPAPGGLTRGDRRPAPGAGPSSHPRPRANRRLRLMGAVAAAGLVALTLVATARPDGRFHVIVLDVGQGDALLLQGPAGGRVLVDTGPDPDRLVQLLDARIPTWDRRLDLLVLTHPHEDHVAGAALLLRRYRVGRVVEPGMRGSGPGWEALVAELQARGRSTGRLAAGDRVRIDGIDVRVLWPAPGTVPEAPGSTGTAVNDVSIVLDVRCGARRFLLMADAEQEVDAALLSGGAVSAGQPRVDVLKVAHHGSRTATTAALLDAVRPVVAAISVGADNDFGHPAPETLDRLAASGARVLRTDLDGTVAFSTNGRDLRIETRSGVWTAEKPADIAGAAAAAFVSGAGAAADDRSTGADLPDGRLSCCIESAGDPLAGGSRRHPARIRSAGLVPRARRGRRGDRLVPGRAVRGAGRAGRPRARRGGGTAARHRQAPPG